MSDSATAGCRLAVGSYRSTAEHLEMSGHAVAKRELEALRARAPVARIEAIDRRALTDDRPRRCELAERERQSSLEVRLRQHASPDVEPTPTGRARSSPLGHPVPRAPRRRHATWLSGPGPCPAGSPRCCPSAP